MCVLGMVRSSRRLTACDVGTTVDTWSASVLELMPYFSSFYAKDNSDPEVVGLLFGVSANHAEWGSVHSLSSASSLFSHLEFGHYVMSPSYLAVLVRCLGVLSWRNAWSDYGYIFASSLVQFLGWSSTCPLVCNDRALVRQWRKLWVPQLHSSYSWSLSLVCGSCRFSGASVEETVVSHRCSLSVDVFLDKVVDMPLLCNGRCLVFGVQKQRILRTCSSSTRCGRPCDFAVTCLAVGGATDSVHRLIWWTSQFAQRQWYVAAMRDPG